MRNRVIGLAMLWGACLGVIAPGAALDAVANSDGIRLGVARFAGDERSPSIAARLADELGKYPLERLLGPGTFIADPGLEPSAEAVRFWAYNAAVEDLLVGRVVAATNFEPERIEIAIRSGHSGVARGRRSVTLGDANSDTTAMHSVDTVIVELVALVLSDLGYVPQDAAGVGVSSGRSDSRESGSGNSGRGLENALKLKGFDSEAPIEIKADEAEIVTRDHGRELVFTHNVLVRQANVTLRSDRLEATYKKGESAPERLVAQGSVFVDQAGRHAKCDRVIYVRRDQRLTCIGHAELVQGCDIVRGTTIRFDLADDRARVEGAASIVIRPNRDDASGAGGAAICETAGGVM